MVFSTMMLGQLDIQMQNNDNNNNANPYLTPYIKINSKCIEDPKLRAKNIKILEGKLKCKFL